MRYQDGTASAPDAAGTPPPVPDADGRKTERGRISAKKVLRIFVLVIISVIVSSLFFSWNARILADNKLPMPFGIGISVIITGSMEPTLHVDDMVVIVSASHYKKDDVIVYQDGNSLVIHRLIKLDEDGRQAVTQGDANNVPDPPIPTKSIKGKLLFSVPHVGKVVHFFKSLPGTGLVLLLAVLLFEWPYLTQAIRRRREKKKLEEEIQKLKDNLHEQN